MTFDRIAAVTGGVLLPGTDATQLVTGDVSIDSRAVCVAGIFACLPGDRVDGHNFTSAAIKGGAAGVLASKTVAAPGVLVPDVVAALGRLAHEQLALAKASGGCKVVGITGSSGKTSTKDLLASVLSSVAQTLAPIGSFNNEIGLPLTVCKVADDTRWLVLEYSARGLGHIRELCEIARPDVAVVLNVGSAHIGEFGDADTTAKAKGELVEALGPGGTAVLNADDDRVIAMRELTDTAVMTVGSGSGNDVRWSLLGLDERGHPTFSLTTPTGRAVIDLRLAGAHQAANASCVAAAALALGLEFDQIVAGLSAADAGSPHRMDVRVRPDGVVVIDDAYNANPESMTAGLQALAAVKAERRIAVLGPMRELGDQSDDLHEAVGRTAAQLGIDRIVTFSSDADLIGHGALAVAGWSGAVASADDIVGAVSLVGDLSSGDVVLVKASNAVALWRIADALVANNTVRGNQ